MDISPTPNSGAPAFGNLDGLTKRELFTAIALQGLLANHSFGFDPLDDPESIAKMSTASTAGYRAALAIACADAALSRLAKPA